MKENNIYFFRVMKPTFVFIDLLKDFWNGVFSEFTLLVDECSFPSLCILFVKLEIVDLLLCNIKLAGGSSVAKADENTELTEAVELFYKDRV